MKTETINILFQRVVTKEVIIIPDEKSGFTGFFKDREDIIAEAETEKELLERMAETYKIVKSRETAKKINDIAQNYLGMLPSDKGCKSWPEMNDKMIYEIAEALEFGLDLTAT